MGNISTGMKVEYSIWFSLTARRHSVEKIKINGEDRIESSQVKHEKINSKEAEFEMVRWLSEHPRCTQEELYLPSIIWRHRMDVS